MLILEGNTQYFTYLFAFEFKYLFVINALHRFSSYLNLVGFFFVFLFISSSFLIYKFNYDKKGVKHLFDEVEDSIIGAFHLVFYKGIRFICLGLVHKLIDNIY
jgi:hypothetical protein